MRCATSSVGPRNACYAAKIFLQWRWSGRRGVHVYLVEAAIHLRPGGQHAGFPCSLCMLTACRELQNRLIQMLSDPLRAGSFPPVDVTPNMYGKMALGVKLALAQECPLSALGALQGHRIMRHALGHVAWCCRQKGSGGWNLASQHVKLTHPVDV